MSKTPSKYQWQNQPRYSSLENLFLTPQFLSQMGERHHSIAGLNRIDIRFSANGNRRSRHFLRVIRKKIEPLQQTTKEEPRAMENGSDCYDFPDDAIDKVAKANCVKMDATQILPEVQASQCAFHSKKDKRTELFINNMQNVNIPLSPVINRQFKHFTKSTVSSKDRLKQQTSRTDTNFSSRRDPPPLISSLPRGLPSKEFVMTWLMHGSEPSSKQYFPDISDNEKKSQQKHKRKDQMRKSTISE